MDLKKTLVKYSIKNKTKTKKHTGSRHVVSRASAAAATAAVIQCHCLFDVLSRPKKNISVMNRKYTSGLRRVASRAAAAVAAKQVE